MSEAIASCESACGVFDCESCVHRTRHRCVGCSQGNALLAAHSERQCAIFQCTKTHNVTSCKECAEPICPFTKSPEMACPVRAQYEKSRAYARKLSAHYTDRRPTTQDVSLVYKKLDKAIGRIPWYLFAVQDFISHGVVRISSDDISRKVGVKPWLVRRDLSQFGEFGRPSLGYETAKLQKCLSEILHLDTPKSIVWVGAARVEAEKSLIARFEQHNYQVAAIFDSDLSRVPEMIGGVRVSSTDRMAGIIEELGAQGAVIATAADEAQSVANTLVAAGIQGILNLTSTLIVTPANVCVRNVDIVAELFALSYYCGQAHAADQDHDGADDLAN